MRRGRRRWRRLGRTANLAGAVLVSAVLLWVMAAGFGTVPPLGAALDAGRGAWTSAAGGRPATSQTLRLPGLQHPVSVTYTAQGIASVRASTDHDAFLALGYVHASFRLAEMDEERRLGEGRLAQLAGPSELSSDEFELRLGLVRTAQREWAQTPRSSPAGQALLAYTQGVNDDIAQVRADGDWPAAFSLARVYPGPWTPVDSLVIQGVLTQELDFTTTPLDDALLEKSLGAARMMAWFPVIPANQQSPYDPGPYQHPGLTPLAPDAASTAPRSPATVSAVRPAAAAGSGDDASAARFGSSSAVTTAAGTLLAQLSRAPRRARAPRTRQQRVGRQRARGGREAARCWPVTRTCRRRCRRSGTRRPCPRPAWTPAASPCPACPACSSGTTRTSPGRSRTPRTRPPCSTPSGPAPAARTSTTGAARGGGRSGCATRSTSAAARRCT